jgi:hypothetical protein
VPTLDIPISYIRRDASVAGGDTGTSLQKFTLGGHRFLNDGRTFLFAWNVFPDPWELRIKATVDGLGWLGGVPYSVLVTVPTNTYRFVGPFPPEWFNQQGDWVYIAGDISDALKVRACRLAG